MADSLFSCGSYKEAPCFVSSYDPVEKRIIVSITESDHHESSFDHHIGLASGRVTHCTG